MKEVTTKGLRTFNNLQTAAIRLIELSIKDQTSLIRLKSVRDLIDTAIKQIEEQN
mgnify:CR=1 FL=1|tara:strand:+ start:445 stop:609 length:165 start_codon:yes stop_codon:yes gene_type:complete